MTDERGGDPRAHRLDRWPVECVRALAAAYRRAKGTHGVERRAVAEAIEAWVSSGGDRAVVERDAYAVIRSVQERHGDWLMGPACRLERLRTQHFRRRGVEYPRGEADLPDLDALLAEQAATAAREAGAE